MPSRGWISSFEMGLGRTASGWGGESGKQSTSIGDGMQICTDAVLDRLTSLSFEMDLGGATAGWGGDSGKWLTLIGMGDGVWVCSVVVSCRFMSAALQMLTDCITGACMV